MKIINKPKDTINKEMYGLFFEDINFAADGGLYAEMLENRSFEARECFGIPGKFYSVEDSGYAWSPVADEKGVEPRLQFVEGTPMSEVNPHYMRVSASAENQGFSNKAYDGVSLKRGLKYKLSFYARSVKYDGDGLVACVEKAGKSYAECKIELKKVAPYAPYCDVEPAFVSGWTAVDKIAEYRRGLQLDKCAKESEWVKYEAELTAADDVRGADFVIRFSAAGVIEFDLISLMPEDAVAGIFRRDLFEALNSIKPGFIRFPGGCIVEGISLENRYRWKRTVGPLKDRKYIPNLWAFNDSRDESDLDTKRPDSHYGQSYGLGFYEYFLLCELLGAKPLPVVGVGLACQFRSDEMVGADDGRLEEYIRDAVDLIEFAKGDAASTWGAVRASMGHPEPFDMDMIGIGNEQWETKNAELFKRIDAFEKAIHAKYPDMKIIGTAGPSVDQPMADHAWKVYREKIKQNPDYTYAVDEHYYVSPQWMYDRIGLYDDYSGEIGVFAGEYAAHPANRGNNMEGALAEAAFLTGIEKNAGVVKLASYAPLFNRIGHSQWQPDMIWFDDKEVFLTPNYYVQKLYANNVGDYTIEVEELEKLRAEKLYISLTGKRDGSLILKAVNCGDKAYTLDLADATGAPVNGQACLQVLAAAGEEKVGLPQPAKLTESQIELNGRFTIEARTFAVLKIKK